MSEEKKRRWVTFEFTRTKYVTGYVDADLTVRELLRRVVLPEGFMEDLFGDEAREWEIADVVEYPVALEGTDEDDLYPRFDIEADDTHDKPEVDDSQQ